MHAIYTLILALWLSASADYQAPAIPSNHLVGDACPDFIENVHNVEADGHKAIEATLVFDGEKVSIQIQNDTVHHKYIMVDDHLQVNTLDY